VEERDENKMKCLQNVGMETPRKMVVWEKEGIKSEIIALS
jgi:G:T-mismatch repair DNA endonuclease (very short patch repair protein)